MPLMISRIGHARGRPVFFAAGRWGAITHHSLSVTSVWYRFVSRICCFRVVGVHMVSPGLVSATPPWNHADSSHSTSFETASERAREQLLLMLDGDFVGALGGGEHGDDDADDGHGHDDADRDHDAQARAVPTRVRPFVGGARASHSRQGLSLKVSYPLDF